MGFLGILYRLIIYPLELFFESVFDIAEGYFDNPGLSILCLSLVVNFLVLPLYMRADVMQAEERDAQERMSKWITHIRKTFKGDERFMMQQTYYRQQNYKQLYVLRSSIPLLLQIPFFIAAYNFLSNLHYLSGVSMGPIKDLAEPDQLIKMGGVTLNLLPIAMTVINIVAGMIYSKGFPIKQKIQMYGIAAIFLVLLYDSPAGLVFYWTLNNVFSLFKNIVTAIAAKVPRKAKVESEKKHKFSFIEYKGKSDDILFILAGLTMAVFTGLCHTSQAISRCPQEYVNLDNLPQPLDLLFYSGPVAFGIFFIWFGVFYLLAGKNGKAVFGLIMTTFVIISLLDTAVVSYTGLSMSTAFTYTKPFHWSTKAKMTDLLIVIAAIIVVYLIWRYKRKVLTFLMITALLATTVLSGYFTSVSYGLLNDDYYTDERYGQPAELTFSTQGKNVVVFMLDRSIGYYVPFIANNEDWFKDKFDGFTFYRNTISYGPNTVFGAPAIFGGPEYSTQAINERDDDSMEDKFNEAFTSLPILFRDNGYHVVTSDIPYVGYSWIPQLSVYDELGGIDAYYVEGAFSSEYEKYAPLVDPDSSLNENDMRAWEHYDEYQVATRKRQNRNFFCYGFSRCLPTYLVDAYYDDGDYHAVEYGDLDIDYAVGFSPSFLDSYLALVNLTTMTNIVDDDSNNFIMMNNEAPHSVLRRRADNYEDGLYDAEGNKLEFPDSVCVSAYQVNVDCLYEVGLWLDYLREQGVYDNTRIIIVADHGYYLHQVDELRDKTGIDMMQYNPNLMIKDFDQHGFTICDDFMTNAVVPYYATEGIIENAANPYTGVPYSLDFLAEEPIVIDSSHIMPHTNPGNTFAKADWYILHGRTLEEMYLERTSTP